MSTNRRPTQTPYNGKGQCRWCGTYDLPKGRRSWCSDECVEAWKLVSNPGFIRNKLRERDRGICAICGADCEALEERYRKLLRRHKAGFYEREIYPNYPNSDGARVFRFGLDETERRFIRIKTMQFRRLRRELLDRGFTLAPNRSFWDADHIVPVAEGGGECDLDNYRTLCHPCHKAETKKLATRLARKRRLAKTGQNELFPFPASQ